MNCIDSVKARKASNVFLAAPVIAQDTLQKLKTMVDDVIALHAPPDFRALSLYYRDFSQTETEEAKEALRLGRNEIRLVLAKDSGSKEKQSTMEGSNVEASDSKKDVLSA